MKFWNYLFDFWKNHECSAYYSELMKIDEIRLFLMYAFMCHPRDSLTFSLLIFFSARLSKNIKISTFEKASKRSHFRSDNQRQISLDLSHSCRYRMRLISSVNSANFFEMMSLARCEYNECMCFAFRTTYSITCLSRVSLYPQGVSRYPKGCLRIRTLYILYKYEKSSSSARPNYAKTK
jgi:hypothetical protein